MVSTFILAADWAEQILEQPDTHEFLQDLGDRVADAARPLSPEGAGSDSAESIFAVVRDAADTGVGEGLCVDISWSEEHFGMGFRETGTVYEEAIPFLRPALEQTRI